MEPKFQTSFIPKGPIATSGDVAATGTKQRSLFGMIALIVFVVSFAISLGVFGYQRYLIYSISKMGGDLEAARTAVETDVVHELVRLDARIISAEKLLARHSIISPLFDFLEDSTVQAVRFTDFRYETTSKGLELVLSGEARGYSAVALQAEAFENSENFKDPIFSDLVLDEKGNVTFSIRAQVEPNLVSYKKALERAVVPIFEPLPASTSTQATTTPASTSSPQATTN